MKNETKRNIARLVRLPRGGYLFTDASGKLVHYDDDYKSAKSFADSTEMEYIDFAKDNQKTRVVLDADC